MRSTLIRSVRIRILCFVMAALAASPLAGCTTNPATGRRELNVLSRTQEIAIGEDAKHQVVAQYGGRLADDYMQAYVTDVGMSMVEHVEGDFADLPWEFIVLDSDVVNAFALPGGKVFITRGLLVELNDEAELAGVLGHEIGHVTARHANKRISNQLIFTGVLVGATVAAGQTDSDLVRSGVPLLVGVGGQGFLLSFGRQDELESDALGMRYMTRAGYDPEGLRGVMEVLEEATASAGSGRGLEFFNTHPHPETRIERIDAQLAENYPPEVRAGMRRDASRYQQRVLSRLQNN